MTKRRNKATGIEAMAGDGFKPSEPTESSVKNMFEELVKDNQTPDYFFHEEAAPIEPLLAAMAKEADHTEKFGFTGVGFGEPWKLEATTQESPIWVSDELPDPMAESPYTRLIEEEKDLRSKFDKLQKFLRDPLKAKSKVGEEHFNLLIKQYGYMRSYLDPHKKDSII